MKIHEFQNRGREIGIQLILSVFTVNFNFLDLTSGRLPVYKIDQTWTPLRHGDPSARPN